jgi:calcium/calmodulin-dependent protein kinase I
VAIKIIDKKRVKHKPEMLSNEVEILIKIDHRNVIKLLDLFDTADYLYLVMELVTGGELFDRIVERESYSEADAKEVMRQLLNAIKYIHANDIVHRDLKPENLLLETEDNDVNIKLSDFGLSKIYDNEFLMKTACGTPGYVAPEILSANPYGPAVDMWSAGVICYILLCGYPPFYNDNDAILFESILNAKYQFHSPYWDQISKPAKDLIRALLVVDPQARLNATQALEMEWFSISTSSSEQPLPHQLKEKLTLFREESKIKSNIKASLITVGKKNN